MARLPRFTFAGEPHHVVQRGHNREPIVLDDEDRRMWLSLLQDAAVTERVDMHAWALLDTRFHLLLTPPSAGALSRMMQSFGRRYVGWFNRRHGRSGTLWAGRFGASVLEPGRYLLACMCYVELQPTRHGPMLELADPARSSLGHHLGQRVDPMLTDHPLYWALGNTPFERHAAYRALTDAGLAAGELGAIAAAAQRGWPLASPAFVDRLQAATTRALTPRPRGRPRKPALTT